MKRICQLEKQEGTILYSRCGEMVKIPKKRTTSLKEISSMAAFGHNCTKCKTETQNMKQAFTGKQ